MDTEYLARKYKEVCLDSKIYLQVYSLHFFVFVSSCFCSSLKVWPLFCVMAKCLLIQQSAHTATYFICFFSFFKNDWLTKSAWSSEHLASKAIPRSLLHFDNIFRTFSEDFRGGTDDVSIIQQHIWVLFKRLCSYSNGSLKKTTWYFHVWRYV